MLNRSIFRIDLRLLILLLAIFSALIVLANSLYASYVVQRQMLIDNTLEANRAYAAKLADVTENFLLSTQQQMAYSAALLADSFDNRAALNAEAQRLSLQTDSFNSVAIADAQALVLATSPDALPIKGMRLDTPGANAALRERRPLISPPYISATGNLLVLISHPIIDRQGNYLGFIGGTIYLKKENILNHLMGEHYYRDGSYLYVVDQSRQLVYHPDKQRVGEKIRGNAVIEAALAGESSAQRIRNSRDVDMLAGYAMVASAGWGIVSQRPTAATLNTLETLMFNVFRGSMPLVLLTLFFIWWCSRLISRPLWRLADDAEAMDAAGATERIESVPSWYFEANQLKRAMLVGIRLLQARIGELSSDAQTDPLTQLYNRRALRALLDIWESEHRPFSAIALDVDHFKSINDRYGHDAGDLVLKCLAELMRQHTRGADRLFRTGGEEFLVLLPDTPLETAKLIAERLRRQVEATPIEVAENITISLGVASWSHTAGPISETLKDVDRMLYQAKHSGRNRVVACTQAATDRLDG